LLRAVCFYDSAYPPASEIGLRWCRLGTV